MSNSRERSASGRLLAAFAVVGIVAAMLLGVTATRTDAAQFDVINTDDSGLGSLRQAVEDAATTPGDDDVVVTPGLGTITLASQILYDVTADGTLTVHGNGATVEIAFMPAALDNQSNFAMTIDGLNVTRSPAAGDVVNSVTSPLTVRNATITGGGINTASGALTVSNVTVTGPNFNAVNTASGSITITDSTLTGSTSSRGVNTASGSMRIERSTITANALGGVNSSSGPVTIINSTIVGNGGPGVETSTAPVVLVYSTVTGNTADGDGANIEVASFQSFATVVLQPQGGPNCGSAGVSNGYNFVDDASCGLAGTGDVQGGGDPLLGLLASNGGPTQTRLPQADSPLLDAIPAESCQADGASGVTTDQRGLARPQGSGCDIGSVEVEVAAPPPVPPSAPAAAVPVPAVARFTG